jgi:hypothetical protein
MTLLSDTELGLSAVSTFATCVIIYLFVYFHCEPGPAVKLVVLNTVCISFTVSLNKVCNNICISVNSKLMSCTDILNSPSREVNLLRSC